MRTGWYIWTSLLLAQGPGRMAGGGKNPGGPVPARWTVEKSSMMSIKGRANIGGFTCDILEYFPADTLAFWPEKGNDKADFLTGGLGVDISKFDCHHRFITNDFRKTLKADDHPRLTIRFLTMDRFDFNSEAQHLKGWVTIELAGVTRKFEIAYDAHPAGRGALVLTGTRDLRFSDFDLIPPSRLAGLIRIEQEIRVEFRLLLKLLP